MNDIEQRALERIMIRRGELPVPVEPPPPPEMPALPTPPMPEGRRPVGIWFREPLADPVVPPPAPRAPPGPPAPIEPLPPPGSAALPPGFFGEFMKPRPARPAAEPAPPVPIEPLPPPGSAALPPGFFGQRTGAPPILPGGPWRDAARAVGSGARLGRDVAVNAVVGAGQAAMDTAADVASALSPGGGMAGRPGISDIENAAALRADPGVTITAPYVPRPHLNNEVAQTVADVGTLLILFASTGGFKGGATLPQRLASGIGADFVNDPSQGGLVSLLRQMGIGKDDLEPLDSKAAAESDQRIRARVLGVFDGVAAGGVAEILIAGVRAVRSSPAAVRDLLPQVLTQPLPR